MLCSVEQDGTAVMNDKQDGILKGLTFVSSEVNILTFVSITEGHREMAAQTVWDMAHTRIM
jgi:hypothetical protein